MPRRPTRGRGRDAAGDRERERQPERTVIIPITRTHQGTASGADYSGVPTSVTFNTGETSKTFDFTATQDEIDDDGEGVKLGFGTMPDPRVSAGTPDEVTVNITDDDTADIVLSSTSLTVTEGGSSDYTVRLATEPTVDVTVTISGHAGTDMTLAGTRLNGDALIFTPDNWSSLRTVTVAAGHDLDGVNDDGHPDPHRRRSGIRQPTTCAPGDREPTMTRRKS